MSCPIADQPDPSAMKAAHNWIDLWSKCKQFESLPRAGGVDDQDPYTMAILAYVGHQVEKRRPKPRQKK